MQVFVCSNADFIENIRHNFTRSATAVANAIAVVNAMCAQEDDNHKIYIAIPVNHETPVSN